MSRLASPRTTRPTVCSVHLAEQAKPMAHLAEQAKPLAAHGMQSECRESSRLDPRKYTRETIFPTSKPPQCAKPMCTPRMRRTTPTMIRARDDGPRARCGVGLLLWRRVGLLLWRGVGLLLWRRAGLLRWRLPDGGLRQVSRG
jgi:hypothetical protein